MIMTPTYTLPEGLSMHLIIFHLNADPTFAAKLSRIIAARRGLPTYRLNVADGQWSTTAYYLLRQLEDGTLRLAGRECRATKSNTRLLNGWVR